MTLKKKVSLFAAIVTGLVLSPALAMAQQAAAAAPSNKFDANSWLGVAAAFAIAAAAIGGTTAQGRATSAALEGIARQPSAAGRIQTPMILGLALIESLVLFAFVVAFLLQGKIVNG
ncbi:MAG: ATP synthase F0 subunit C [Deltaproteobacteria bacterium]|nr:ATP synthase F0 subunit C [Deltaproteobacteria bacterium]